MIENAPAELRNLPQWVMWRGEKRDGKTTKIPYDAKTGHRASSSDPATWTTFDQATGVASMSGAGVGFVFTADDPYVGVDFDGCVNGNRAPHDAVARIVAGLDSYTEVSPSGTGLHVIVRGELNGSPNRTSKTPWGAEFEVYDRGRYFCVTGDVLEDKPIAQRDLSGLLAEMFPPATPTPDPLPSGTTGTLSDEEILEKARRAKNAGKFTNLWAGDVSGHDTTSEADLALCSILAFWTQDVDQIDRLFRRSALMRPKWERADYREPTIAKALGGETYNGEKPKPKESKGKKSGLVVRKLADVIRDAPDEPDWLLPGLIAKENDTMLYGPAKVGKSTLLFRVLRALEEGGTALELQARRCSYYLLSEEGDYALARKARNFGMDGSTGDTTQIHNAQDMEWEEVIEDAIVYCTDQGHELLVVDTIARWAKMTGSSENDSGAVIERMGPLTSLAKKAGIATLTIHHSSKKGGKWGEGVRGSSAFVGAVDIVAEFARTQGDDIYERELSIMSRIHDPGYPLRMRLDGNDYEMLESTRERGSSAQQMLAMLSVAGSEGLDTREIAAALGITYQAVDGQMKKLLGDPQAGVFVTGKGGRVDPYKYHRATG